MKLIAIIIQINGTLNINLKCLTRSLGGRLGKCKRTKCQRHKRTGAERGGVRLHETPLQCKSAGNHQIAAVKFNPRITGFNFYILYFSFWLLFNCRCNFWLFGLLCWGVLCRREPPESPERSWFSTWRLIIGYSDRR